jgi:hypothetical protein
VRLFSDRNQDEEFEYLAGLGYYGTMDDKQKAYLSNAGFFGTISDMKAAWSGYNTLSLFSNGKQGVWYDPSDLSTLFQDSAGTTPVTTAGQPVGKMLDKSGRGNHATQATSAKRPTYAVAPLGGRRNLLSYSQNFLNASWVALNAATLTATETGPDGVSGSAYLYKDNSAGGTGQVYLYTDLGGLATSTSHTYSCFLKADQLSWAFLEINNFTTPVNSEAWFDLSNGVVGTVDAGFDQAFIEDVGDGWYRCSVSFTTDTSDTAGRLLIRVADADADTTVDLDGTSSILIYGAQFELGSTPSSYIPTAGSTVTRAAETLTASAANLPWPTPVETTGIELVTNGDFATNDLTGFTTTITGTGSVDASTGAAVITATDGSNKGVLKWTGVGVPLGPLVLTFDVTEQTYVVATSGLSGFSNTNYNAGTTVVTVIATSSTPSLTFENAGSNGNTAVDNISVKEINPLSVSIQISGKMTYADDNSFYTFIEWSLTASNYISLTHDWRGALTGRTRFLQFAGGVGDFVEQTTAYPPGLNVPFNLASRHGSTFINGAIDGTALTANTTPVALPDLESTDLEIAPIFMGHINKFGVWDVDIGDSGIVREST